MLGQRASSIQVLSKECKSLRNGKEVIERRLRSLEGEVANLARREMSVPALVSGLKRIYAEYCADIPSGQKRGAAGDSTYEGLEMAAGSAAGHAPGEQDSELERQRRQLENQMQHWRRKFYESEERIQKDYKNFIAENSQMLSEVNDLRKENKGLKLKVRQMSVRKG